MAIQGVSNKTFIPYVLEDDRTSSTPTIFHIRPKTGHDNNKTVQRYAQTAKENRKGYREIDVNKLDVADMEEFIYICNKVENYIYPEDHPSYKEKDGVAQVVKLIEEEANLREVAKTLGADHLAEVLEVSNNLGKLKTGEKKSSN